MNIVTDETRLFELLSALICRHARGAGKHATPIPAVRLSYATAPTEPRFNFAEPAVYFVVQGLKQVTCNGQTLLYGRGNYLLASIDMPVSASIVEASEQVPCMGIHLTLRAHELGALILESGRMPAATSVEAPALYVGRVSAALLDAVVRLAGLLDTPADIAIMAPLITREILFRLLQGDRGGHLAQSTLDGGRVMKVSRAIKWLKDNFAEPLRIEELARVVTMSQSSLHHHFKAVTGMSPLQYQKALRLEEARRRLISEGADVTRTGLSVGYDNSSQFIREYSRQFGVPPLQDLMRLKGDLRR